MIDVRAAAPSGGSRDAAAQAFGVHKERKMSENEWSVLKIASLVLAVVGMTALVLTIAMGHNGVQGY